MPHQSDLTPAEQIRMLAFRMQTSRTLDQIAMSATIEALARSRELLRVPVYGRPKLRNES